MELFFAGNMSAHTEQVIRDVMNEAAPIAGVKVSLPGLIAPDQAIQENL